MYAGCTLPWTDVTSRDALVAPTYKPPRVLWYPSCLCVGPYFPLYPRYHRPRPLLHLRRARNMTLYMTLRSCQVARRTVTPAPEALPPRAPVQGMLQFMGVYRHRALPLPAKAGDARSTSAVHATALSHPCAQRSTVAAGAAPSCMRSVPGSLSVASRAHTAE